MAIPTLLVALVGVVLWLTVAPLAGWLVAVLAGLAGVVLLVLEAGGPVPLRVRRISRSH